MKLEKKERVQTEGSIFGKHAKQQQSGLVDDAMAKQQSHESERKQPAAGSFQRLVDIWKSDGACDGPAVDQGADGAAGIENLPELLRQAAELLVRRRHESPVRFPRAPIDLPQPFDLALEFG